MLFYFLGKKVVSIWEINLNKATLPCLAMDNERAAAWTSGQEIKHHDSVLAVCKGICMDL